jgi:hypothetical protein
VRDGAHAPEGRRLSLVFIPLTQGRLIFAGGSAGDWSNGHLIWIIHNAAEPGYR